MLMKRLTLAGLLAAALFGCAFTATAAAAANPDAADSPRQRLRFDFDWKFKLGDAPGAEAPAFADAAWRALSLPHDFSIEGTFDAKNPSKGAGGFAPLGVGWYRKTFRAPAGAKGKLLTAEFDGVMFQADVWLNGHKVGHNDYGYIGFACDLTPYIKYDGDNVLAVRADNSKQASRWYTGSGIYRHVWLSVTDRLHVARNSVNIAPIPLLNNSAIFNPERDPAKSINYTSALVFVAAKVNLPAGIPLTRLNADVKIVHPDGTITMAHSFEELKPVSEKAANLHWRSEIFNPVAWSPDSPKLYRAVIELYDGHRLADVVEVPFGIRDARFDPDQGFRLNGKKTLLKGVCLHHDLGALGAAAFDRAIERRLEILKSMGVNALRLSHNPYSPEMLDLADRMGFLVFDEAFDKWKGFKPDGTGWAEELRAFIERDCYHPSVVIWSVGNEVGQQGTEEGAQIFQAMHQFIHSINPSADNTMFADSRPVTAAIHPGNPSPTPNPSPLAQAMSFSSLNYQTEAYDFLHRQFPWQTILGSETLPFYTFNLRERDPKLGMKTYPGNSWFAVREKAYVAGQFIWAGIAYLGESSGWPSKGWPTCPIDTAGFPNPNFYIQQSYYSTQTMVRIAVDDPDWWQTPRRVGWGWPGMAEHWNWAGRGAAPLKVYTPSNAEAVELILNGKSLGERSPADFPDHIAVWEVPFAAGTLKAVAKRAGQAVAEHELKTAGAPARLELVPDRAALNADGQDLAHVAVRVVDAAGTLVPGSRDLVRFELTGAGTLAGVDNGDMTDTASYKGSQREARRGRALAIVQAGRQAGELTLTAHAAGLPEASVKIQVR